MASPNAWPAAFHASSPTIATYTGNYFSGSVFFVSSTHSAASDANAGTEPELPKATWTNAYDAASAGDLIVVSASHTETISASDTLGVADVLTLGLGSGSSKPRFTSAVAGVMWNVTAAGVAFMNLYFPASTAATTSRITMSGDQPLIVGCDFECGANDATTGIAIGAVPARVENCSFTATASRPARAIRVTGAAVGLRFKDITIAGSTYGWTNAALSVESNVTRAIFENIQLSGHSDVVFNTTGASYKLFGVRPVDNTGCRIVIAA